MYRLRLADLDVWLPHELASQIEERLDLWDRGECSRRLREGDTSLWTGDDENRWLGWLEPGVGCDTDGYARWCREVAQAEWSAVVLLGMGGSSLGAQLLCEGTEMPGRRLVVLDTTDPDEIAAAECGLDIEQTLFVVASKSGSTVETVSLDEYFYALAHAALGTQAGRFFLAITDEGTGLDRRAAERGYHRLHGPTDVGGRFSVLTPFGLAVATAMGVETHSIVTSARQTAECFRAGCPAGEDPGVALGLALGVLATAGHGLLTVIPPPDVPTLGDWLEQLLAESTGKGGGGILPVLGETRAEQRRARVEWAAADDCPGDEESRAAPVLRLAWRGGGGLGREIFRWELATAVAGSILSVHPFVQPDVESAKVVTRALLEAEPGRGVSEEPASVTDRLARFADRVAAHPYVAVLAYLPRTDEVRDALSRVREAIALATGLPTTLGFGPRYLHSTGQLFKAGPVGSFLFLTRSRPRELSIPGAAVGFGELQAAQAEGDMRVLRERGRQVVRVELSGDLPAALARLAGELVQALSS